MNKQLENHEAIQELSAQFGVPAALLAELAAGTLSGIKRDDAAEVITGATEEQALDMIQAYGLDFLRRQAAITREYFADPAARERMQKQVLALL